MSDDWDTVTKIGSKARSGAGGPRETTVKSKSQLNAAMRSGAILATEKKYGTANAASSSGSGQFLTKVDRSDDIVKPKEGDKQLADFLGKMISKLGTNRTELARAASVDKAKIDAIFNNRPTDQDTINKIERTYGLYVRGVKQGEKKGKFFNAHHAKLFPDAAPGTEKGTEKGTANGKK